jgi:hypothetical protein
VSEPSVPTTIDLNTRRSYPKPTGPLQASLTIAMTIPIKTNTTIANCVQIQIGDTPGAQRTATLAPVHR